MKKSYGKEEFSKFGSNPPPYFTTNITLENKTTYWKPDYLTWSVWVILGLHRRTHQILQVVSTAAAEGAKVRGEVSIPSRTGVRCDGRGESVMGHNRGFTCRRQTVPTASCMEEASHQN